MRWFNLSLSSWVVVRGSLGEITSKTSKILRLRKVPQVWDGFVGNFSLVFYYFGPIFYRFGRLVSVVLYGFA